jgi:hypothetical protein
MRWLQETRQSQRLWRNSWWFKNVVPHRKQKDSNVHFHTALYMNNRNSKGSNSKCDKSFTFCRCFITCSCMHFLPWAGDSSSQPHILFHYKGATESFGDKIRMHSAASSWLVTICALFQDILYEPIKVLLIEIRYFVYIVYEVWVEKGMGKSSCSSCYGT